MSTVATGSPDIALLDSKIVADLCLGKFCVDVSNTIYIGSGENLVLGANVEILNPFGIIIKPYGTNYEIAPALSGAMDAEICFNIPIINTGNIRLMLRCLIPPAIHGL